LVRPTSIPIRINRAAFRPQRTFVSVTTASVLSCCDCPNPTA
jgi:hypothetical protein